MSSTGSVMGLVRNHAQADAAVEALLNTGFVRTDVATLYLDKPPTYKLVHIEGLPNPEHTAAAASIGGVIGAALGLLAGFGVLAIPVLAPFIAAVPIMTAICGALAGAAAGSITGMLAGMGISEIEARQYARKIKRGAILLSVHADDRDQRAQARKVLKGYGATNIATLARS